MTEFALIISILSLVGLLACITALVAVMKSIGQLKTSLEKLDAMVGRLDASVAEQKTAMAQLEAKMTTPRTLPVPHSFADSVVQGLFSAVGTRGLPPYLSPVLSFAVRQIVGYLGNRVATRKSR